MKLKYLLAYLLIAFTCQSKLVFAQEYNFSGTVVDVNTNKPIPNAEVQINDYPITYSNAEGFFSIKTDKLINKPDIVDATRKGFKIMGWGKLPESKGIRILMKPEQIYFTGRVTDHNNLLVIGAEVVLEGFNNNKPVKTNEQGYFEMYLPLDYKLNSNMIITVNKQKFTGESLHYDEVRKSVSIQLPDPYPPLEIQVNVKFTDKNVASFYSIIWDGKEIKTDNTGKTTALISPAKLQNIGNYIKLPTTTTDVKIYSVRRISNNAVEIILEKNIELVFPVTSSSAQDNLLTSNIADTTSQAEETKKEIESIITELEEEKNALINKNRRLGEEIKRIKMRIVTDKSLLEKEKDDLRTYLARLEAAFLSNEKAYLEAQERTKRMILEMRIAFDERDSLYKEEIASIEEQVRMLEAEKDQEAAEIRQKLFWATGIGVFVALLAFIFYGISVRIRRQKNELQLINEKLNVTTQNLEVALADVRFKNQKITDSIRYAKTIQEAILPSTKLFADCFNDHFVFFRPKDYVSGDFYWLTKIENVAYLAVVDCTGHGVPGAFMSMIGNAYLNEIIIQKEIEDTAVILQQLDIGLRQALKQDEKLNSDGMDIALCRLENQADGSVLLRFSGAKRNALLRRRYDNAVEMLKADRISIGGIKRRADGFTQMEVILQKGDMIYLTTDGYVDQFSDETQQKFGTSRFIELINKIAHLPAYEQRDILIEELETHQKQTEQRDDITVVGVRI